jgi:NADH dehydrogenase FAD-containing subunit
MLFIIPIAFIFQCLLIIILFSTTTCTSPHNHFVFTPMLAGAIISIVEYCSITKPIREICPHAEYLEATASNIDAVDAVKCIVMCQSVICNGNSCEMEEFIVSYNKEIVTVRVQLSIAWSV